LHFCTKPQIALEQLRWAHQAGLPRGVALLDAGYGNNTALRDGITALGMHYAAGICATTTVWAPGTAPLPAKKRQSGRTGLMQIRRAFLSFAPSRRVPG
jgi:SRSO17 transposase